VTVSPEKLQSTLAPFVHHLKSGTSWILTSGQKRVAIVALRLQLFTDGVAGHLIVVLRIGAKLGRPVHPRRS